jgi:hypothetical protein
MKKDYFISTRRNSNAICKEIVFWVGGSDVMWLYGVNYN